MKKITKYKSIDGTEFELEEKALARDFAIIKSCFSFHYSNPTENGGEGTNEEHDFADYGVDSKTTINKILDLINGM